MQGDLVESSSEDVGTVEGASAEEIGDVDCAVGF